MNVDDDVNKRKYSRIVKKLAVNNYMPFLLSPLLVVDPVPSYSFKGKERTNNLAPVVQRLDSAIHWINHYPADSMVGFVNTYPLDSDLSGG